MPAQSVPIPIVYTHALVFSRINLMRVIIFYLLTLLAVAAPTIIATSNLRTPLVTPGYFASLSGFHNVYHTNMLGNGAFWIWNNEGLSSPLGRSLTFETLFYSECMAALELNITADHNFRAYFDGRLVAEGSNWRLINSLTLNTTCGSHNLTIIAQKGFSQYGPGLIFTLSQDQSSCFKCGLNGLWDYGTCSC